MNSTLPAIFRRVSLVLSLSTCALLASSCSRQNQLARDLAEADHYYAAGDLVKAEIEYKNVLQKDAGNLSAISRLGLLYHEQGRDGRAAAFLLHAREAQPENLDVRLKLGLVHFGAGGLKQAREEALHVLQHRPADAHAPLLLAEASANPLEREQAREIVRNLPGGAAEAAPALVALGNLALRENRAAEAEMFFSRALSADAECEAAHAALGVFYWSRQDLHRADASFRQAAKVSRLRSPHRLHYAQFKLKTGDAAEAKRLLAEITEQTPDYLPAWVWRAELALADKKLDEAESYVTQAIGLEPLHAEALLLSARLRLARGEAAKAVDELERMSTMFPRSPLLGHQLSLAYAAKGDTSKAIAQLTQVIATAPGATHASVTLAELHVRNRDYTAAVATLKPLVQQHPELTGPRLLLAESQRGLGNLGEAEATYASLARALPDDAQIAFAHGTVLLQMQNFADARVKFSRACELQPGHIAAVEQLVELDIREQQLAAARERLATELARNPDAVPLWFAQARLAATENDTAGAETALKKILELQPDSTAAHYLLARLYVASKQQEKAIAALRETTRRHPKQLSPLLLLGVLLDDGGDHAGAREAYEQALALEPKSTLALNNLSYLYAEHFGRATEAVELAQRARAFAPQEPRTADTLGWALVCNQQYAQALPLLQESAEKLVDEPEVLYHLGVARYMLGDDTAALAALQRACELNPGFRGSADARRRVAVLQIDPSRVDATGRSALEAQLAKHPRDPAILLRLAEFARQNGDADKALAHSRAILELIPKHPLALLTLARIHAAKRDYRAALEAAKSARSVAPDDPLILHVLGRIAYDSGDHRWAESLLHEVARTRGDDAEVLCDWAEAAFSVGRISDAETSMQRALGGAATFTRADHAKRFLEMLALCAEPSRATRERAAIERVLRADANCAPALLAQALAAEPDAPERARERYEALLSRFPELAPAQRNLTLLYAAERRENRKAAALAARARAAYPDDAQLLRATGFLAYHNAEFVKALPLLQEVAKQNAADAEARFYLGMAQMRLNKHEEGRASLERALELGLPEPLAREAKKTLAGPS